MIPVRRDNSARVHPFFILTANKLNAIYFTGSVDLFTLPVYHRLIPIGGTNLNSLLDLQNLDPIDAIDILAAEGFVLIETIYRNQTRIYIYKQSPSDWFGVAIAIPVKN